MSFKPEPVQEPPCGPAAVFTSRAQLSSSFSVGPMAYSILLI